MLERVRELDRAGGSSRRDSLSVDAGQIKCRFPFKAKRMSSQSELWSNGLRLQGKEKNLSGSPSAVRALCYLRWFGGILGSRMVVTDSGVA